MQENDILKTGTAFPLVKALQKLNAEGRYLTEILIMSKNSADTSLRIFNSIEHYNLNISRAALVGGASISPYLGAFKTDLFLSANETDVQEAINANIASGIICDHSQLPIDPSDDVDQIRIAFDGDAVIFSDESEKIYQEHGLQAFAEHEHENARKPLPEGPFAKLLKTISIIQNQFPEDSVPIRTALLMSRSTPSPCIETRRCCPLRWSFWLSSSSVFLYLTSHSTLTDGFNIKGRRGYHWSF